MVGTDPFHPNSISDMKSMLAQGKDIPGVNPMSRRTDFRTINLYTILALEIADKQDVTAKQKFTMLVRDIRVAQDDVTSSFAPDGRLNSG